MNKIRQWINVICLWLGIETMCFAIESSWKKYVYDDLFDVEELPSRKEDESPTDWAEKATKTINKRKYAFITYIIGASIMGFALGKIGKLVACKMLEDNATI